MGGRHAAELGRRPRRGRGGAPPAEAEELEPELTLASGAQPATPAPAPSPAQVDVPPWMSYLETKRSEKHERLENLMEGIRAHDEAGADLARQRTQKAEQDIEGESKKRDREAMATLDPIRGLESRAWRRSGSAKRRGR